MTTQEEEIVNFSSEYDPLNLNLKTDFEVDTITLKRKMDPYEHVLNGVTDITTSDETYNDTTIDDIDKNIETVITNLPIVEEPSEESIVQGEVKETFHPNQCGCAAMRRRNFNPIMIMDQSAEEDILIKVKHNVYGLLGLFIIIAIILIITILITNKKKIIEDYYNKIEF